MGVKASQADRVRLGRRAHLHAAGHHRQLGSQGPTAGGVGGVGERGAKDPGGAVQVGNGLRGEGLERWFSGAGLAEGLKGAGERARRQGQPVQGQRGAGGGRAGEHRG